MWVVMLTCVSLTGLCCGMSPHPELRASHSLPAGQIKPMGGESLNMQYIHERARHCSEHGFLDSISQELSSRHAGVHHHTDYHTEQT